jgi:hypothetical protein
MDGEHGGETLAEMIREAVKVLPAEIRSETAEWMTRASAEDAARLGTDLAWDARRRLDRFRQAASAVERTLAI